MPDTQQILGTLKSIANDYRTVAIIWHAAILFFAGSIFICKWMPANRTAILIASIPFLSVAIIAWLSGNPFNGILFSILTILLIIFGFRTAPGDSSLSSWPFLAAGILMVLFGFVYPHFLDEGTFLKYLYASPVGLIPCPTLSLIIGFVLIFNGFGSPQVTWTLIAAGLFYSVFGVLKLNVRLDLFLLAGTLVLLLKNFFHRGIN